MRVLEVAVMLAVVALAISVPRSSTRPVEQWGIRWAYFDPRIERTDWVDSLGMLGKHVTCNDCRPIPSTEHDWLNQGIHQVRGGLLLEIDVELREGACETPHPWGWMSAPNLAKQSLFLGDEPLGHAILDKEVPHEAYLSPNPNPRKYKRIQYRFIGLTDEEQIRVSRAIEAHPYPEPYENLYDPRAGTYAGKPIPAHHASGGVR